MKKLILLVVLCTSGLLSQTTYAQITFRINIGSQPIWGPTGYDHVEYYYLPDIDIYYYVPRHQFIIFENGRWIIRTTLPTRYRQYDLYNARKIVINEPRPYLRHNDYKSRYGSSRDHYNQQSIRDSRDSRYYVNKSHPEHNNWKSNQRDQKKRGNQRHDGKDRGREHR